MVVGWSGGALVLGNLPVPGRPTNLVDGRASAVAAGGYFFSRLSFLFSFSLSLGDSLI